VSFLKRVYKVTSDALGYMSKAELKEKLPEVYKAYESAYGNLRPDIRIQASTSFSFPVEKYSHGSWHVIFAILDGHVKPINVEQYYGKSEKLVPNSMFLDCMKGNLNLCYLYVHPDAASPLLTEAKELSDDEYLALAIMSAYKPFAREKEYFETKYKYGDAYDKEEFKNVVQSLADKGLVKINKAGSAMLTLEGKNRSIDARKKARTVYKLYI
jgi:hypothetical protein